MTIPPMALAMVQQEHTDENWINAWAAGRDQTVAGPLGIDLIAISKDACTLRMPITNAARQPFGLLHGGVSMVLAETAASMHARSEEATSELQSRGQLVWRLCC